MDRDGIFYPVANQCDTHFSEHFGEDDGSPFDATNKGSISYKSSDSPLHQNVSEIQLSVDQAIGSHSVRPQNYVLAEDNTIEPRDIDVYLDDIGSNHFDAEVIKVENSETCFASDNPHCSVIKCELAEDASSFEQFQFVGSTYPHSVNPKSLSSSIGTANPFGTVASFEEDSRHSMSRISEEEVSIFIYSMSF